MMHDSPLALVALFPGSINTLQGSYNGRMMPESPGFGSLIPRSTHTSHCRYNGRMMPDSPLALVALSLGLPALYVFRT